VLNSPLHLGDAIVLFAVTPHHKFGNKGLLVKEISHSVEGFRPDRAIMSVLDFDTSFILHVNMVIQLMLQLI
jgi:hypothetical protein